MHNVSKRRNYLEENRNATGPLLHIAEMDPAETMDMGFLQKNYEKNKQIHANGHPSGCSNGCGN